MPPEADRRNAFFVLCCLGKIAGGAPFSQLHKSDKQSRVDKPQLASNKLIQAKKLLIALKHRLLQPKFLRVILS